MSERTSNRIFDIVNVTFIALFVLFCLAPFVHVIAVSLSSTRAITSGKLRFSRLRSTGRRMCRSSPTMR